MAILAVFPVRINAGSAVSPGFTHYLQTFLAEVCAAGISAGADCWGQPGALEQLPEEQNPANPAQDNVICCKKSVFLGCLLQRAEITWAICCP